MYSQTTSHHQRRHPDIDLKIMLLRSHRAFEYERLLIVMVENEDKPVSLSAWRLVISVMVVEWNCCFWPVHLRRMIGGW